MTGDAQNPPLQNSLGAHCRKQAPQLNGSDVTSTQTPPQQAKGKTHRFPHAPQWFGSKAAAANVTPGAAGPQP